MTATNKSLDPYSEENYEVIPGLIHKFKGRALWLISTRCASYCQFCMRKRIAGNPEKKPYQTNQETKKVFDYLSNQKEINEIILSGGDPLFTPQDYLSNIINGLIDLQKKDIIKVIRINTRLPIHNPALIKDWHYQLLSQIKNPYLLIHINHPLELTEETINVINNFRKKSNAIILGQSVLLKGVNDDINTLCKLFNKMSVNGIIPYCLYQNDPVPWAKDFTVPVKEAIKIWQAVRPKLSGIAATARFIIEPAEGFGKVAVPEGGSWDINYSHFYDFKGKKHSLNSF